MLSKTNPLYLVIFIILSTILARSEPTAAKLNGDAADVFDHLTETANFNWRFIHLESGNQLEGSAVSANDFDDTTWTSVDLPHDWSITVPRLASAPGGSMGGFAQTGVGWYRKVFSVPENWRGKVITLAFDGVYKDATIWLNGSQIGHHYYGYTAFQVDLSAALKIDQSNVLAVEVDNSSQPSSRWYSGSGIFRPVSFEITNLIHIPLPQGIYVRTPVADSNRAQVLADVIISNDSPNPVLSEIKANIVDKTEKSVAESTAEVYLPAKNSGVTTLCFNLASPRRWSLENPYLYHLDTKVSVSGNIVDHNQTSFGIRKLEFDPDRGLLLNDVPIKLRGGCIHNDDGPVGSAAFAAAEERKVRLHKEVGFNVLRTAHNPPSSALLKACDEQGILVLDELFDEWKWPKLPAGYAAHFDQSWQQDMDSFIQRDRNHPSVIMWSIGNEVAHQATPEGGEVATKLVQRLKTLDSTRLVTQAICSWSHSGPIDNSNGVLSALDVIGCNYLPLRYPLLHQQYPGKPIIGTESFAGVTWYLWQEVKDNPWVLGDFVWPSMDYFGERGSFPTHVYGCGDLNLCGQRMPQSWYHQQVWGLAPNQLAIFAIPEKKLQGASWWNWSNVRASWTWPGEENQPMIIDIYSVHPHVELSINGHSVGMGTSIDASNLILQCAYNGKAYQTYKVKDLPGAPLTLPLLHEYKVPYQAGQLQATALDENGKVITSGTLSTAGHAAQIRLVPEKSNLVADGQDLLYVEVEISDQAGALVPNAAPRLRWKLSGEATLQGVADGSLNSTEPYSGTNEHLAYNGKLLLVLRSTRTAGLITLTVSSNGLPTATLNAQSQLAP